MSPVEHLAGRAFAFGYTANTGLYSSPLSATSEKSVTGYRPSRCSLESYQTGKVKIKSVLARVAGHLKGNPLVPISDIRLSANAVDHKSLEAIFHPTDVSSEELRMRGGSPEVLSGYAVR